MHGLPPTHTKMILQPGMIVGKSSVGTSRDISPNFLMGAGEAPSPSGVVHLDSSSTSNKVFFISFLRRLFKNILLKCLIVCEILIFFLEIMKLDFFVTKNELKQDWSGIPIFNFKPFKLQFLTENIKIIHIERKTLERSSDSKKHG